MKSERDELLEALEALVERWHTFTGDDRGGWENMENAYYDLAKHAQKQWANAEAAIAKARGESK